MEDYYGHVLIRHRLWMPLPFSYEHPEGIIKAFADAGLVEIPGLRRTYGLSPIIRRGPPSIRLVFEKPTPSSNLLSTGLEEREIAVAQELALVALLEMYPPAALMDSQVLVFTDPETFDLIPLVVRWGRTVAVDYDGLEADALRSLLNKLPLPKGAYAIGGKATEMLLKESENPVWIASRGDALRRLGLDPDDLPPVVQEAIEITRDYLGVFV